MRLIAFITEGTQIRRILDHIGVDTEPPHISPARGPPLWDDCDAQTDEGVHIEPDWDLAAQPAPNAPVATLWGLLTALFHGEPATRAGNPGFARGSKPVAEVYTAARAVEWLIRWFNALPDVLWSFVARGFEPLLDRGARKSRGLRDCAVGELVAQLHAPDLAYHFHGDHLFSTC